MGGPPPVADPMTLAGEPFLPTADTPAPGARRRTRIVQAALLVGGLTLLAVLLRRLGVAVVLANLRLVGAGIVLVIGQEILAYVANTLGWRATVPRAARSIPFPRLLAARIAGDAVNYLTPTASFGGEVARVRILRDAATTLDLAASVAVAKVTQTVAQVIFLTVGLAALLARTPLPEAARTTMIAGTLALAALAAAAIFGQRRGMFAPLARLAALGRDRAHVAGIRDRLRRLDVEIARFHDAERSAFVRSTAWFLVGWAAGAVEIYLILWLLGVPATAYRAFTIEALSVGIDGVLFFVPAKLGTQEGGKVLIFTALGLDPATGLSLGVIRRIRELTWALIGTLILFTSAGTTAVSERAANPVANPAD